METEMFEIVGGPSKYDFLTSLSFRKQDTQRVVFKVRNKKGVIEEFEVEIMAVMQTGESESGEEHQWRFLTGCCPRVLRFGSWKILRFSMLGTYFTGGKNGRKGHLKTLTYNQRLLLGAAFGHPGAWEELKNSGFKIPDTRLNA